MRWRTETAILYLIAYGTLFECYPQGGPVTAVVFPQVLEERSDDGELTVSIRANQTLRLKKASVLQRVLDVTTFEGNEEVVHYMNGSRIERDLYHDPKARAALLLTRHKGVRLYGILGPTERIQPSLAAALHRGRGIKHEIITIAGRGQEEKDTSGTAHQGVRNDMDMALTEASARNNDRNPEERTGRSTYPINSTCETRIAVDSTFFDAFKEDKNELVRYIAVLMAFVNLKLQTFQDNILRLQVMVIGIIIYSKEKEEFIDKRENGRHFMLDTTLYKFNLYISKEDRFKQDDIVVLITGLDLAGTYSKSDNLNENFVGLAAVGGACGFHKAALIEDLPRTFSSAHTTAHEIGHLLGAYHDGSKRGVNSTSQIDPADCPAGNKNIMAPSLGVGKRHDFSYCSTTQIAEFILSQAGHCLTTISVKKSTAKLTFPAIESIRTSLDDFCKRHHDDTAVVYKHAGKYGPENCFITCEVFGPNKKLLINDAPDGTPCNKTYKRMVCLNGECTRTKLKPVYTIGDGVKTSVEKIQ